MSFYDDASLVFLPSGGAGKDTKAYSIKPTNGDGDFTFSRGSNLTATRVDSNGLIEKGRENLLEQSNQFDTTWAKTNVTLTSGQSGYDGSTDAWKIEANTSSTTTITQAASISGVMTASIYAKEGTTNWFRFSINDSGVNTRVWFDLSGSGAVGSTAGNIIDSKIESVGNGYFRCSITFNATAANLLLFLADANSSISPSAGDYIYIQDAQLEIGLTSTEYIESGASKGLAGILEDSPRFDYSGGASCPSLLLEPSRTNILEYSEYIDSWTALASGTGLTPIVTNNYTISPEGVKNATRLKLDIGTGTSDADFAQIQTSVSTTTGTTYAGSIYFKSNTGVNQDIVFQINGQSIVTTTITPQWTRYDASAAATSTGGFFRIRIRGNEGTNKSADFSVYGAQLEEGSYPTSYIPNHSGGSVTREADSCSGAGTSSTFNDSEGVLYAEFAALADDQTSKVISLSDGTFDERVLISTYSGGSNQIRVFIKSGGSFSATITTTLTDITDFNKIAFRYKSGETKLFINGSLIDTSTDTFSISGLNALQFASGTSTATPFYGNAKQVIVFNTALSDADCITLTS